jgi:hypothetical protein
MRQAKNNFMRVPSTRKQVSHKIIPSTLARPEDFKLALGKGDLRVRFRRHLIGMASSSNTDDDNKSMTCIKI